jgi:hypothetical protein
MELNNFDEVEGVVTTEDIVEGRFVLMCEHTWTNDFGSMADLPGVKLPDTAVEAAKAHYILTWAVDNRKPPLFQPNAAFAWAYRDGGFDQTQNTPLTPEKVYLTYPGYTDCETIPSGTASLAFTDGTFTVRYGCYVYDANIIVKGASIGIANDAVDGAAFAGMPKYVAAPVAGFQAETVGFDTTTGDLTIRVK